MTDLIQRKRRDRVLQFRLVAGEMNVLRLETVRALKAYFREAEADPMVDAVALLGGEKAFSSGLDNAVLYSGGKSANELVLEMGDLLYDMYRSRLRIVAGCSGHAVAAGAMLLLVSDLRYGAQGDYRIGFSEVVQGLPLPELPVLLARDRLGRRYLQSATVLGRLCRPSTAVSVGFLDRIVEAEKLEETTMEAARSLSELVSSAYSGTVEAVRGVTVRRMQELLEESRTQLAQLG
jgi:enoyl-CoA hydratase